MSITESFYIPNKYISAFGKTDLSNEKLVLHSKEKGCHKMQQPIQLLTIKTYLKSPAFTKLILEGSIYFFIAAFTSATVSLLNFSSIALSKLIVRPRYK